MWKERIKGQVPEAWVTAAFKDWEKEKKWRKVIIVVARGKRIRKCSHGKHGKENSSRNKDLMIPHATDGSSSTEER